MNLCDASQTPSMVANQLEACGISVQIMHVLRRAQSAQAIEDLTCKCQFMVLGSYEGKP